MTKRKLLLVALSLCMVAILAMGGTLAYLTDDEQITNTMVIGDIEINIDEWQKNAEGKYEPFKDDSFVLFPIENEQGVLFRNKVVYTANESPNEAAAYIRTIVLFEKNPSTDLAANEGDCCLPGIHFSRFNIGKTDVSQINGKTIHSSTAEILNDVTIDNVTYHVVVFTDINKDAIPAGEALYSLCNVYVDQHITSEQMEKWGDQLEIKVFSQGIQAEGLEHDEAMEALGVVNQDNLIKWLGEDNAVINDQKTASAS